MTDSAVATLNCRNCTSQVEFNYCPACGQKKAEQRLTLKHVYLEFIHDYLGFDKGIFYTTKNLLLRPGYAVNEYLDGRRKPYLKPLQYYLILLTLYFVVSSLFDIDIMQLGQDISKDTGLAGSATNPKMQHKLQRYSELMSSNLKVISTLMIPLMAMALLIVYRKKKYNFTELLIFSLYVYGLSFVFYSIQNLLLALPLSSLISKILFYAFFFISYVYIVFAIHQFFGNTGWMGVLKAIWALILSYIGYFLLATVLSIIVFSF